MKDPSNVTGNGFLWELPYKKALKVSNKLFGKEYIASILKKHKGNVTKAARHACINRGSLHRLMRRYGVRSSDFKV